MFHAYRIIGSETSKAIGTNMNQKVDVRRNKSSSTSSNKSWHRSRNVSNRIRRQQTVFCYLRKIVQMETRQRSSSLSLVTAFITNSGNTSVDEGPNAHAFLRKKISISIETQCLTISDDIQNFQFFKLCNYIGIGYTTSRLVHLFFFPSNILLLPCTSYRPCCRSCHIRLSIRHVFYVLSPLFSD